MSAKAERERLEALYEVFKVAALDDQRRYYRFRVDRCRKAARQVNFLRALFSLLTGLASALAGLLIATAAGDSLVSQCALDRLGPIAASAAAGANVELAAAAANVAAATADLDCTLINVVVPLLLVVAVVAPALGAAFTTLADLFQWDRQTQIYDTALENLEVADAHSPVPAMNNVEYQAALNAFAEGTLTVMRDETTQWGQLIRTPESLQKYIDAAVRRQSLPGAGEQTGGSA
ncbi:MAG: hypothetical protein ACUVSX_08250 [Aggregatilineales bacterium]